MKNVLRLLLFAAVVATFARPAFAQTAAAPAGQDPKAVCIDLYNKWRENRNGDAAQQKISYDSGKEYLAKCGSDEYVSYVQKWVAKYDNALRDIDFNKAIGSANHVESFRLGRQILTDDPDNVRVLVNLAYAGLLNATSGAKANTSLDADAMTYAQRAIQLIQSGKTTDNWAPFTNKDDALGWLNYALGVHNFKQATGASANYFIKAAQANSTTKQDPSTYYYLATAYQKAEYKPLADDYQATCAGKDLTDECKTKLNTMNLVVDRIIDAYARAISLAGTKPQFQSQKADWTKQLTGFYKFRNNDSDAGLNDLISGIQSKPLLLPGMQSTTAPAPAPTPTTLSSTPPSGNVVTTTTTTTTTGPAAPSVPKPATPTVTTRPATTTTTNSAKPKTTSTAPPATKSKTARRP